MAFIELTEDEFAMLGEAEKTQYNRQLKLYRERVEFVKKLDQIENADFQYKKPKLKRINPIRRIDIPQRKKVKSVSIVMPLGLVNSKKLSEKTGVQRFVNTGLKERLGTHYIISNFPAIKKAAPNSSLLFDEKKKYAISDVSEKRYKVTVPTLKFKAIGKMTISSLPVTEKFKGNNADNTEDGSAILAGVIPKKYVYKSSNEKFISDVKAKADNAKVKTPQFLFRYSETSVKVKKTKVNLPQKNNFAGDYFAKLNAVPTVSVETVLKKHYVYKPNNEQPILDVKIKADNNKVKAPHFLFRYVKKSAEIDKIKINLPKAMDFTGMYSAQIRDVPAVSVGTVSEKQYDYKSNNAQAMADVKVKASGMKFTTPDISFETPSIDLKSVPKFEQIGGIDVSEIGELKERISSGSLMKIDSSAFRMPVPRKPRYNTFVSEPGGISVPTLKKYQLTSVTEFIVYRPPKVQLPTMEIHTPNYTKDYVRDVIDRIMIGTQGA